VLDVPGLRPPLPTRLMPGTSFESLYREAVKTRMENRRPVGENQAIDKAKLVVKEGGNDVAVAVMYLREVGVEPGTSEAAVEALTAALRAGADKVSMNSSIVKRPELISEAAAVAGAQCVVASIDCKREGSAWRVYTHGGKRPTGLDALEWAKRCVALGAGELLLTSIDRDGARTGYDLELTRAVADSVAVPVIASGGAGDASHLADAFTEGHAEAALLAGILHDGLTTVGALKAELRHRGLDVRKAAA